MDKNLKFQFGAVWPDVGCCPVKQAGALTCEVYCRGGSRERVEVAPPHPTEGG